MEKKRKRMRKTPNFSSCESLVCHATPSKAEGGDNVGTDFFFYENLLRERERDV
jgi:hypothetical protein